MIKTICLEYDQFKQVMDVLESIDQSLKTIVKSSCSSPVKEKPSILGKRARKKMETEFATKQFIKKYRSIRKCRFGGLKNFPE